MWQQWLCAGKLKETQRREKERERERGEERVAVENQRTKEMMAKAFVIPPTHLPTLIPPFLSPSHPIPPSSWLEPEVHLFFSALAWLVRSSCCCSLASGKWRLLQTHTSCPSGEALVAKDTMNHFSHTWPTEVNKVAEDRTSLPNKLQTWLELYCFLELYCICSYEDNSHYISECWMFRCTK